jgi:hypothetical protein
MLAEIMTSPGFGEIMFLVAFILFAIEAVRLLAARTTTWDYSWLLIVCGLACMALGWVALTTGDG